MDGLPQPHNAPDSRTQGASNNGHHVVIHDGADAAKEWGTTPGGGIMLGILVPSRGRPHNLRRLMAAIGATAAGEYRIYTRIDDDDPTLRDYRAIEGIHMTVGPRVFYGASLNELAPLAIADGCTHLAMFGDDVVPETVGWDEMLIQALGNRLGVAYGSDGLERRHGVDLPTHYVTQAEIYARLGWFYLPTLRHLYGDNVAREIGKGLGNFQYVPGAKLSHLHRWNRKAPDDLTYQEANDKDKREIDRAAYETWRNGQGYIDTMKALA